MVDTAECFQPNNPMQQRQQLQHQTLVEEKLEQTGQLPNVLDVVDEASVFDEISIPNTPDIDMEEPNLTTTLEGEQTNYTNENTNEMNKNTIHTKNHH